jgi:hypothetical protein
VTFFQSVGIHASVRSAKATAIPYRPVGLATAFARRLRSAASDVVGFTGSRAHWQAGGDRVHMEVAQFRRYAQICIENAEKAPSEGDRRGLA